MYLLRAARQASVLGVQPRRFLSDEVSGSKRGGLHLNLVLPHKSLLSQPVQDVIITTCEDGQMGIFADHAAGIHILKPGTVEVNTGKSTEKYFAAGGFAVLNPNSVLDIFATEACKLDEIDKSLVTSALASAKSVNSTNQEELNNAKVKIEVYEALLESLPK